MVVKMMNITQHISDIPFVYSLRGETNDTLNQRWGSKVTGDLEKPKATTQLILLTSYALT